MRLDLILLVCFAGPSAAVPGLKSHTSFRRASGPARLNRVLADLSTVYPDGGTVPPVAVASTTSTPIVAGTCSCDNCPCGNEARATSTASARLATSVSTSSHNPKKRSEPKDAGEHNKQKQKQKEDKPAKHTDEKNHDKDDKKAYVAQEEATEESDHDKYEDALYGNIGEQIKAKLLGDKRKGHDSPIGRGEKPVYVITQQYKFYKCDDQKGCREDFGSEKEAKEVEGKQQAEDEDKDEDEGSKVENEEERDWYDEEGDPPMLANGDEAEQLRRLQELYMQWRGMLVEAIRKDLDPILKNDQFPEDTEMAAQHQKGDEKEQRKRLSLLYMNYRHMLVEKFIKLLDPILYDENQKTD
ncbi:hypothetical protein FGADI_3697 [Fusarium gaditjirri]|uniref:Uncharacterized protein n=1 Tax=Fusarium gaditjirri TaxID=282569 RepID=A0A8H4WZU6_9HYPO|nr:hypothetical protein FGADI_3697 [Fusarium gaditjirri]